MDDFCLDFRSLSVGKEVDPIMKIDTLVNNPEDFSKIPQSLLFDPLFFTKIIMKCVQDDIVWILEYYAKQDPKYLQDIMLASIEIQNYHMVFWCKERMGRLNSIILNKAFETKDSKLISILFS